MLSLKETGLAYHPDLVIVNYVLNDAGRAVQLIPHGSHFPVGLRRVLKRSDLVQFVYVSLKQLRFLLHGGAFREVDKYPELSAGTRGWEASRAALAEIARIASSVHAATLVVVWPMLVDLGPGYPHRAQHQLVVGECEKLGIPVLDLLPTFEGHDASALWAAKDDHHPNGTALGMGPRQSCGTWRRMECCRRPSRRRDEHPRHLGLLSRRGGGLVRDGEIVAAAQEERFTRKKHDADFPAQAIGYCLEQGRPRRRAARLRRLLRQAARSSSSGCSRPTWRSRRAGFASFAEGDAAVARARSCTCRARCDDGLGGDYEAARYVFTEHHESHAASAFFPSPFEEAAILTLDGVGEWATASLRHTAAATRSSSLQEMRFPHSLGLLYSAFTYYSGFAVNSGEYKLMGLAPYGEPKYVDLILENLIDLKDDGSFRMDMSYFNYCQGLTMTSEKFDALFGGPPRKPESPLTERDMDIAASIQKVTEEIMLRIARHVHARHGHEEPLPGGRRGAQLRRQRAHPARGTVREHLDSAGRRRRRRRARGGLCSSGTSCSTSRARRSPTTRSTARCSGRASPTTEIRRFLDGAARHLRVHATTRRSCDRIARLMADGKVIGWFQGRMEFGPRALGCRSILGDPRNRDMQTVMNVKVKFREGVPAVRAGRAARSASASTSRCGRTTDSPYMLLVAPVDRTSDRLPLDDAQRSPRASTSCKRRARDPRGHARRLLGPRPDGRCRATRALSPLARALRPQDRLPGHRQHELQPGLGPDRLHRRARRTARSCPPTSTCCAGPLPCCRRIGSQPT